MSINKWSLRKSFITACDKLVKNWNEGAHLSAQILFRKLSRCETHPKCHHRWTFVLQLCPFGEKIPVVVRVISRNWQFRGTTWRDDVIQWNFRHCRQHYSVKNHLISLFDRKTETDLMERMHVNPNLDYIYTRYTSDIVKQLNLLTNELEKRVEPPMSQNDVILFSLGSWPHSFGTLRVYKKNLNSLFEILKSIKQNPKLLNLRLVFWTPPSAPDGMEYRQRMRTGYDLGAMASYVCGKMKELKIEVLDMFNPTNIRNNENLCNGHYICRRQSSGMDNVVGEVGLSFQNNLAILICENWRQV